MKVTLISNCWIHLIKLLIITFIILQTKQVKNTIIKPPWSNPNINPCASFPNGWQLIYWKPLNRCFKLFTLGFPCPPLKELVPLETTLQLMQTNGIHAACKCPPLTIEIIKICYPLYRKGPCEEGEFTDLIEEDLDNSTKIISGTCKTFDKCPPGMAFAANIGKCVYMYTRGPCPRGELLFSEYGLAICKCATSKLWYYYDEAKDSCYEHYTRGPCRRKGMIYLPEGQCGCKPHLPHYHFKTGQCYELGTQGPCELNNIYAISLDDKSKYKHGKCVCKNRYVRWLRDGICYPIYTRGPCLLGQLIISGTKCITYDCNIGELYYPKDKKCYEIGEQGPCSNDQIFRLDYRIKSLIDGQVSYNGICECLNINKNIGLSTCTKNIGNQQIYGNCNVDGMGKINGVCYKLYSRGPCNYNEWVEPNSNNSANDTAVCKCQSNWMNFNDKKCNRVEPARVIS